MSKNPTYEALEKRIAELEQKVARNSEESFRTIFNNSPLGIELYDHDGIMIDINQRACEMFAMKPQSCIHKVTLNDHPNYQSSDLRKQLNKGREIRQKIKLSLQTTSNETEKTETRYYQIITTPLMHISPTIGYFTQIFDITEQELSRIKLREEKEFLNAIVDTNHIIIVGLDKQHLIRIFSKGAEEITGYSRAEVLGEDWCALFLGFENQKNLDTVWKSAWEQDYKAFKHSLANRDKPDVEWDPIQEGNTYTVTGPLQTRDGTIKTILWQNTKIYSGVDESLHLHISIGMDITDRKQAKVEKEKLESQLHQAQKMESVGRLAGGVAHDFNNMLSVILGNAEIAMEDLEPTHSVRENLQEINNAALRSSDVVRQLLAFARKQTIAPKVLDLNEAVQKMLKMLRRLIGEDINLSWNPMLNLWPVKIDTSQIDQILANLCVNARDAISGVGKLTIETGRQTFGTEYCKEHPGFIPGDFVVLAVSDNGCGMDKDTMKNLFEPFYTTKEMGKGTGLGLATVYGIVKQNNGFINVYSEPDQGTTFRIYLPRYLAETEILEEKPADPINLLGTETILLVEDEPSILGMTRMMLERMGYKVIAAGTPGEAIALAHEHAGEIHLLMTDVVMPEMNGRDLARNILSVYSNLKLLFMSGYTTNVIAHQGVLDEGVQFIQKPFSKNDLAIKLREVLDEDNL